MKIKKSEQLKTLAGLSNKRTSEVSNIIVSELIQRKIVEDIPENYGNKIIDCVDPDTRVMEAIRVIEAIGMTVVKAATYDAFTNCVLIGDGDCPECGGDMEVVDGEYRHEKGNGLMALFERETIWEELRCRNCGHRESNEQDEL